LPNDRTLALPPDPIRLNETTFDPIRHFKDWRALEKAHSGAKDSQRGTILAVLQGVAKQSYPSQAKTLNAAGLRTHSGKEWNGDNLRKFLLTK
jgi:hypothetical protein